MKAASSSSELICGRHPVLEALRAGRACQRLLIARGSRGVVVDEIFARARSARIPYDLRARAVLDRLAGPRHQGVVAYLAARAYADFGALLAELDPRAAFLVFLDGIQDPHNLGAIVRSACAAGADAVIVPERGACGLSAAALKAAAGAAEHLPLCRVPNLRRALQQARSKAGLWIAGLDPGAERSFAEADFRGPCGLVVGAEGRGLRRLVRAACDFEVRIPMARAEVGSLNASVAAALVLYEVFRQRHPGE